MTESWGYLCIETQSLGPHGLIHCVVFEDDDCIELGSGLEAERRARLMAAAPELAALVESVEWTKTSDRWGNWDGYECPWCLCYTDKPENGVHATDCPRRLALGKARGE